MYDSLQGVYHATLFVAPVVEVDLPDRTHLGRWGPSPRCYTMGHLVRPRSSSRNAQLMGKRKKIQKHVERDGWEEDFEIWSDMMWAPMIYSFFHILWFPPQELVRGSQHCQQPLVTVEIVPAICTTEAVLAKLGLCWAELVGMAQMFSDVLFWSMFHIVSSLQSLPGPAACSSKLVYTPIQTNFAHSLGKHDFLPAQGFPRMLAWP